MGEGAIVMGWLSRIGKQAAKDADLVPAKNKLVGGTPEARLRAIEQGFDVETPLYHGTAYDFDEFGHVKNNRPNDADTGQAFFFSTSPEIAGQYASDVSYLRGQEEFLRNPEARRIATTYEKHLQRSEKALLPWTRDRERNKAVDAAFELERRRQRVTGVGEQVIPAYAKLQNPKIVEGLTEYDPELFARILADAKKNGHDGVIFKGFNDSVYKGGPPADTYAVFKPENIRSKFAAFDPSQSGSSKLLAAVPAAIGGGLLSRWAMMQNGDQYT